MKAATQHVEYVCPGGHMDGPTFQSCQFCAGGLSACSVCDAFEGATTTHCPGYRVDGVTWDEVYAGKKDFRFGKWIDRPSRISPAWWGKHRDRLGLIENWQSAYRV